MAQDRKNQNTPERLRNMAEGRRRSEKWRMSIKNRKIDYPTGEKHWNWKGGITPIDHAERVKFKREIQKKVFERDDYTCQICGIRGKDMTVDHIQSWAEYVELRFNIENCRTLCAKCHYQITFGKPMPPEVKAWGHHMFKGGTIL